MLLQLISSKKRWSMLNNKQSPIMDDNEIEAVSMANKSLWVFKPTTDKQRRIKDADFVIIATPTDYDPKNELL